MRGADYFATAIPFLIASVLVGVALLGRFLTASRRAEVEHHFLRVMMVAVVAGWAGSLLLALRAQQWGLVIFWGVSGPWGIWRIMRKLREARTAKRVAP